MKTLLIQAEQFGIQVTDVFSALMARSQIEADTFLQCFYDCLASGELEQELIAEAILTIIQRRNQQLNHPILGKIAHYLSQTNEQDNDYETFNAKNKNKRFTQEVMNFCNIQ